MCKCKLVDIFTGQGVMLKHAVIQFKSALASFHGIEIIVNLYYCPTSDEQSKLQKHHLRNLYFMP